LVGRDSTRHNNNDRTIVAGTVNNSGTNNHHGFIYDLDRRAITATTTARYAANGRNNRT
jgi:hypothetical protein